MHQLKIGTVKLPKVYVADDNKDAKECRRLGVPYFVKPSSLWTDEMIAKVILSRTLKKMFPKIRWDELIPYHFRREAAFIKVCFPQTEEESIIHSSSDYRVAPASGGGCMSPELEETNGYRDTGGETVHEVDLDTEATEREEFLSTYLCNEVWEVNIDELQQLKILPTFLDDIAEAVKANLGSVYWNDGWNKKLGAPLGSFSTGSEAPNLIVLDVSGSIPSGVATTMIALLETLRTQANADILITGWCSKFFSSKEGLPTPAQLDRMVGGCNECGGFYKQLRDNVLGKHWGNVIIFGDDDAPEDDRFRHEKDKWLTDKDVQTTEIENVLAFHTRYKRIPGYGRWVNKVNPNVPTVINVDWVHSMYRH